MFNLRIVYVVVIVELIVYCKNKIFLFMLQVVIYFL